MTKQLKSRKSEQAQEQEAEEEEIPKAGSLTVSFDAGLCSEPGVAELVIGVIGE